MQPKEKKLARFLLVFFSIIFGSISIFCLLLRFEVEPIFSFTQNYFSFERVSTTLIVLPAILSSLCIQRFEKLKWKKFNIPSAEIEVKKIFYVAILSSVLNSFFSTVIRIFFNFYSSEIFTLLFLKFLIGDILGVLFVFFIFITISKLINYKHLL